MRVTNVKITPIAIPDVPLANTKGVHASMFSCAIIKVETDTGLTDLREANGTAHSLSGLQKVAPTREGHDP